MVNERDIVNALQKGVVAAMAQSDNPSMPVKYLLAPWAGVPQDQKWLEVVWIPNNRQGDFLGQEMNHRGILRLVLHWPNTATGVYAPISLMESITRYFTNGRLLSTVQIYGKATADGLIEDGDEVLFPVSIYYQSFRKGT